MSNKTIAILSIVALLTSFAVGRWSAPDKIKTVVQTVTIEKKTDDKTQNEQDHKRYVTVETVAPNGTKIKTTTITDDKGIISSDKSTDNTDLTQTKSKEVDKSSSKITMQFLGGLQITAPGVPIYGVSVSRPILGPITVGFFGMSNKVGGLSIGLTF